MEKHFEDLRMNQSLKDRVYDSLRAQIIKGIIEPGSRLPEEELSKAMSISRAPIREALNMLERDGFITIIPRKGAIVSSINKKDVQDIWEMRRLLEPYAASTSAHEIPENEIDKMIDILNKVLSEPDDFEAYMRSDLELHELLYRYVNNKLLKDILMTIKAHSLRIRYFAENNQHSRKEIIFQVTEDHILIINALKSRDAKLIHQSVLNHVVKSQERSLKALDRIIDTSETQ